MRWYAALLSAFVIVSQVAMAADPETKVEPKPGPPPFPVVWTITEGCDHPESAQLDLKTGHLFVSQIGGDGGKKDGVGWISRYTLDGKTVAAKWVEGLNAPKGIRIHGNTLFVSDLDTLVVIDIAAAKITARVAVPKAKFLNDVAAGPDGTAYVSDMLDSTVYQYKDGNLSVFASGDELECPNGLLFHDGKLICGGWGLTTDFTTKTPGRLFAIDPATKTKTLITREPTGNLDGIESDGAGGYIVTDWVAGRLLHVGKTGMVKELAKFGQGAADHCYLPAKKLLILPHMLDNKVVAYDLSKMLP